MSLHARGTHRGRLIRSGACYVVALAWLMGAAPGAHGQGFGNVFTAVSGDPGAVVPEPAASGGDVLRQRLVRIDEGVLEAARLSIGDGNGSGALRLNVFDDLVFNVEVYDTGPTAQGYWLAGRIHGVTPGSLILVRNDNAVAATVLVAGETYSIRGMGPVGAR